MRHFQRLNDILRATLVCSVSVRSTCSKFTRSASTPGWLRNSYETTVNQPWDTTISSPITYVNGVPEFITTHEKYEFGSIFASARSGDLDEFDVAVAALALQYEQYSIDHPVKALLAKVAVKSRVPRAFARAMAAMRSE